MPPRPWILAETNWRALSTTRYEVAVLPWGATEAHNYHLPYGTDVIEAGAVAAEAARLAWVQGARVVVLPTVPFGVQTGQLDIPFCLNLNPSTQAAILADLVASLEPHGVRKLVLLNGHGGNDFRAMVRELQPRTRLLLCTVDWWKVADARAHFDEPGDHAGELETSVMLHLTPDLVLPLEQAGAGRERRARVTALRDGWAWTPRPWTAISEDTGVGDPSRATAAKGAAFVAAATARIASFLVELATVEPGELYE